MITITNDIRYDGLADGLFLLRDTQGSSPGTGLSASDTHSIRLIFDPWAHKYMDWSNGRSARSIHGLQIHPHHTPSGNPICSCKHSCIPLSMVLTEHWVHGLSRRNPVPTANYIYREYGTMTQIARWYMITWCYNIQCNLSHIVLTPAASALYLTVNTRARRDVMGRRPDVSFQLLYRRDWCEN
jgi:hypothetical protein